MSIRFDDRVAIVTGAGGGIGKQHALELAKRGAKVVVNDLGGSVDGSGASDAAEEVVSQIKSDGGEAISNGASVTDLEAVKAMVEQTMSKWGRIDILVNNAGILRDKSFHKVTIDDFNLVMDVHFQGTLNCTHSVFPIMREQEYGRIVFTSSSSGVFGNFGQTNYGSAKMAMVGLMNTLKLEGQNKNIYTNSITPVAYTRMTEGLIPEDFGQNLQPEFVTPAVIYLSSEHAPNGAIMAAGAGGFSRIFIESGLKLTTSFLEKNLVDDIKLFISNEKLKKNGKNNIKNSLYNFLKNKKGKVEKVNLFGDTLISYKIK